MSFLGFIKYCWMEFWRTPPKSTVICARFGESLGPPPGSCLQACDRCANSITVAPLTFLKLRGKKAEFICIQCAAAENPNAPLGPMDPMDLAIYMRQQGCHPLPVVWTVGQMNNYMKILFKRGDCNDAPLANHVDTLDGPAPDEGGEINAR